MVAEVHSEGYFSRNVLSAHLSEVSGMVLVKVDSVVMLTTGVTAASGMLPVLPDPAMTMGHVSSQLPSLLLGCGHSDF